MFDGTGTLMGWGGGRTWGVVGLGGRGGCLVGSLRKRLVDPSRRVKMHADTLVTQ